MALYGIVMVYARVYNIPLVLFIYGTLYSIDGLLLLIYTLVIVFMLFTV